MNPFDQLAGAYALHLQCDWAISEGGMRRATSDDPPELGDKVLGQLLARERSIHVRSIESGTDGRLRLELDRDLVLEAWPLEGHDGETWRLFRPGSDEPHFVRYPDRAECE